MKRAWIVAGLALIASASVPAVLAVAEPTTGSPDPWPRQYRLPSAELLIYQPQVETWQGNRLSFRAAVGATPPGAKEPAFGVVWADARTEVDPIRRAVTLQDVRITRANFPTLADDGAIYVRELQRALPHAPQSISLDRLEASLAASAEASAKPVGVDNRPPEIIVSTKPAILIPVDGAPVLREVAGTSYQRVVNTAALILRAQSGGPYYLHAYDGWLSADQIDGPWRREGHPMWELDQIAKEVTAKVQVDLLNGGGAQPAPSLADGVPTIYVRHAPAELIVFKGAPNFQPVGTTPLLWAANTTSDVLFDTTDNKFYVLISGRWYRSAAATGPWSFVSSKDLPAPFKQIPPSSPSGVVLATVAGTPQAKEAVIEASIPRTATVPRKNGPRFEPAFDGAPQLRPIEGTSLHYVVNSPDPIIEVAPGQYYALRSGIWFAAPSPLGPWTVATFVPAVIYKIPPTSPLHYVTYVEIYGATPDVVYEGYTPGYLGSVVAPDGVVVYGTGYDYQPWVGSEWYPPPATYGVQAEPVYNPAVGWAYGAALGLTTAALVDSWGHDSSAYYYEPYYAPGYHGYPCCGSTSAQVYGQYGDTYSSGTEKWYSDSNGNEGRDYSGSYTNDATGTTGHVSASQNFNEKTGETTDSLNRNFNTVTGSTGDVQRSASYNPQNATTTTSGSASASNRNGDSASAQRSSSYDAQTGASSEQANRSASNAYGGSSSAERSSSYNPQTGESSLDTSRSASAEGGSSITRQGEAEAGAQGSGYGHDTSVYNAHTGETHTYGSGEENGDRYAGADGQVYRNTGSGWEKNTSSGWQSASAEDTSWADREQQARSQGADRFSSFSGGGWDRFGGGQWGGGGGRFGGFGGGDRWGGGGGWGGRFGGGRFGGFRR